jgi:hypothetical protein
LKRRRSAVFLNLSGCGVRNVLNEDDIFRHPPRGDLAVEEAEQLGARSSSYGSALRGSARSPDVGMIKRGVIDDAMA